MFGSDMRRCGRRPHGASFVMTRLGVALVMVGLTTTGVAFAGESTDERKMQAQTLVSQGQKLSESDPKGALAAFRVAYDLRPDFHVQYNIAKVCVRLGDHACARVAFEKYLKDGGNEVPAKKRREVDAQLKAESATARPMTAVTITSGRAGAYVKVDGVVVGRTPIDKPIAVGAGTHKLVLVEGGNVTERSVQVAAGTTETVDFDAQKDDDLSLSGAAPASRGAAVVTTPASASATSPGSGASPSSGAPSSVSEPLPPAPPSRSAEDAPRRVPVLPWIVTGVLAAGTAVSGVLAAGAYSDFRATRERFPITKGELEDAHDGAKDLVLATSLLGAATLVSGGLATYLTLARTGHGTEREGPSPRNAPFAKGSPSIARTLAFAVGPNGVSVMGRLP